jgi:hypothetical protein
VVELSCATEAAMREEGKRRRGTSGLKLLSPLRGTNTSKRLFCLSSNPVQRAESTAAGVAVASSSFLPSSSSSSLQPASPP